MCPDEARVYLKLCVMNFEANTNPKKKNICTKELKKLIDFDPDIASKTFMSDHAKAMAETVDSVWCRREQIFSADPCDHWVEVTDRCQLSLSPIWFPGTLTIFKIPVQLTKGRTKPGTPILHDCVGNIKVNGKLKPVIRLGLDRSRDYARGDQKSYFDSQLSTLYVQVDSFEAVYTGLAGSVFYLIRIIISELRLVYHWSKKEPGIWLRVPLSTNKMPELTFDDMIPVHTGKMNFLIINKIVVYSTGAQSNGGWV